MNTSGALTGLLCLAVPLLLLAVGSVINIKRRGLPINSTTLMGTLGTFLRWFVVSFVAQILFQIVVEVIIGAIFGGGSSGSSGSGGGGDSH